jgi:sec-independent protein translocase protein TatC
MQFMPAIAPTFSLYVKIVLALGLTFQMPVVVFFLARLGVVTHRTLIHYGRYAVLVAFIVGAVVTPPDIVSQVLLAAPLVGLYGLAIGIAWLCAPSKRDA